MNAPARFPPVRQRLRIATDQIHQALHRAAPFAAIADGTATHEGYSATLSLLYRFHAGQAPACLRAAQLLSLPQVGEAHAARLAALEADIRFFGGVPQLGEPMPRLNEEACIGALYTVQGSTLGGKILYRQLDSLLSDDCGREFFKGSSDDGRHWQALCAALETKPRDIAQMEAGALAAFHDFQRLLG